MQETLTSPVVSMGNSNSSTLVNLREYEAKLPQGGNICSSEYSMTIGGGALLTIAYDHMAKKQLAFSVKKKEKKKKVRKKSLAH